MWRLDTLLQLGLRLEFDAELIQFDAVVARLAVPGWDWRLACIKANLAMLEDRLADVPGLITEALHLGELGGVEDARWVGLTTRSDLARRTGVGLDAIESEVRQALVGAPFFAQGWRALLLTELGRLDEASAIWRTIAPQLPEMPTTVSEWLVAMAGYAETAVIAKDKPGASQIRRALEPYADQQVTGAATTPYGGPVSLALGELSAFLGDRATAERWLAHALRRAEGMNSPRFADRAREALAALGRSDGPLSPRESEVARLVAAGESNRAIAGRLFLSERTVEQHVSSALRKLGLSGRSGLAAWVVSQ